MKGKRKEGKERKKKQMSGEWEGNERREKE